jgi:ABC-type lipoprotein export system ATPase subunit
VKLAVASTLGTLRKDRKRNTPTLFTGSSGIGKSMVLDILGDLLPQGTSDRVSALVMRFSSELETSGMAKHC